MSPTVKSLMLSLSVLALTSSSAFASHYRMPRPDRLAATKTTAIQALHSSLSAMTELDRTPFYGPGTGPSPVLDSATAEVITSSVQAERDAHELFHGISAYLRPGVPSVPGSVVSPTDLERGVEQLVSSHARLAQAVMYARVSNPVAIDAVNALGRSVADLEAQFSPWNSARELGARMDSGLRFARDIADREKRDRERYGVDMRTAARLRMAVQKLSETASASAAVVAEMNVGRPDPYRVAQALRTLEQQFMLTRGTVANAGFSPSVSAELEKGIAAEAELAREISMIR